MTILVGDVGGTHARFAIVDVSPEPWRIESRLSLDEAFPSFADAMRAGIKGLGTKPDAVSIAVAGPVTDGTVSFTNRGWSASEEDLRALGFKHWLLINDFAALAFATQDLSARDLRTIGPQLAGLADQPISIVGAGTGFGVSCLARYRGRAVPVSSEGGHMGFAPSDEREIEIARLLARKFGRVSVERILSGPGIENLFEALGEIAGMKTERLDASEIQSLAERGDKLAGESIAMFCSIFGAAAGDIALAFGARGGVFLAGGVSQKLVKQLERSDFRKRFEDKGRLSHYVKPIPTRLILSEDAAFLGAARASLELRDRS